MTSRDKLKIAQKGVEEVKTEFDAYCSKQGKVDTELKEAIKEVIIEEKMLQNYKWVFSDDRLVSRCPTKKEVDKEIQELCDLYPHGTFDIGEELYLHGDDGTIGIVGNMNDLSKFAKSNGLTIQLDGLKERKEELSKSIKNIDKILKLFS